MSLCNLSVGWENASFALTALTKAVISYRDRAAREDIPCYTFISPQVGADISHNVHDLRCGKISNFLNGLPCAMCEIRFTSQVRSLHPRRAHTHTCCRRCSFLIIHRERVKPKVRSRNACIIQHGVEQAASETFGSPTASHRSHNAISRAWRVYSRNLYITHQQSGACDVTAKAMGKWNL